MYDYEKKVFPIIISAAQHKQPKEAKNRLDPLNLMFKTCEMAIKSTDYERIEDFIDSIQLLNINCWSYEDAPRELSKKLGIDPKYRNYLSDSGSYPQMLINRTAKAIELGKIEMALITGAEAKYSTNLEKRGKTKLDWSKRKKSSWLYDFKCSF